MGKYIIIDEDDKQEAEVIQEKGRWRIVSANKELAALDGKPIPLRAKPVDAWPTLHTDLSVDFSKEVKPTDAEYIEALTDYAEQLGYGVTRSAMDEQM